MARIAAIIPAILLCRLLSVASTVDECRPELPAPAVIPSIGLKPPGKPSTQYLNPTFRYETAGIDLVRTPEHPVWTLPFSVDWRSAGALPGAGEQQHCAASWAFAAAAALDAAQAIGQSTARAACVSVQQLLDCAPGNATCAAGGWPPDAFEYAAGIAAKSGAGVRFFNEQEYPYAGTASHTHRCRDLQCGQLVMRASSYEAVSFSGALGLLLAAQHQPVVAFVAGGQPSFRAYDGMSVYANTSCFVNGAVNHAVLIVGYNLGAPIPYWILRNSWGRQWGCNGYMKMAITGGDGICGINTSPGYYPVVQGRTPCGPPNPCGSGRCIAGCESCGRLNYCLCPEGTVPSTNIDGSSSCIIADVCSSLEANPCGVGTCVSDQRGNYTCICPPGFARGTLANCGFPTCFSVASAYDPVFVAAGGESCYLVAVTYALTAREFKAQNPALDCSKKLPAGAIVNVTTPSYGGCSTFYPVDSSGLETCGSIAEAVGLSLRGLAAANRGLNCARLLPGMQICIAPDAFCGSSAYGCNFRSPPLCTRYEAVGAGDSCTALAARGNLSLADLYQVNPGVYCRHLAPRVSSGDRRQTLVALPGTQLCVNGSAASLLCPLPPCQFFYCNSLTSHVYRVRRGDTCTSIVYHQFRNSIRIFYSLNAGVECASSRLYIGEPLCAPGRV